MSDEPNDAGLIICLTGERNDYAQECGRLRRALELLSAVNRLSTNRGIRAEIEARRKYALAALNFETP